MKEQLDDIIEKFEKMFEGEVSSPAQQHLFQLNDKTKQYDNRRSEIFHSVTAKLIYLMKKARPDLETLQSYLSTRVSKSGNYEWKELKGGLMRLKNTIVDKRVILERVF